MSQHKFNISRKVEGILKLAGNIFSRHQELGKASPLSSLAWNTQGPKVAEALAAHKRAEELKRQMEIAYEQRNALIEGIDEIVKQSRDVLKGVYRSEPRKLGEFGFEVTSSTRTKKEIVQA